jgi:hypothetical protein
MSLAEWAKVGAERVVVAKRASEARRVRRCMVEVVGCFLEGMLWE